MYHNFRFSIVINLHIFLINVLAKYLPMQYIFLLTSLYPNVVYIINLILWPYNKKRTVKAFFEE